MADFYKMKREVLKKTENTLRITTKKGARVDKEKMLTEIILFYGGFDRLVRTYLSKLESQNIIVSEKDSDGVVWLSWNFEKDNNKVLDLNKGSGFVDSP